MVFFHNAFKTIIIIVIIIIIINQILTMRPYLLHINHLDSHPKQYFSLIKQLKGENHK